MSSLFDVIYSYSNGIEEQASLVILMSFVIIVLISKNITTISELIDCGKISYIKFFSKIIVSIITLLILVILFGIITTNLPKLISDVMLCSPIFIYMLSVLETVADLNNKKQLENE
jgi:cytochrome c biogenesis factor